MRRRRGARSPAEWVRLRRRMLLVDGGFTATTVLAEVVLTLFLPLELRPAEGLGAALGWSVLGALPVLLRRVAAWPAVLLCSAPAFAWFLLGYSPLSYQVSLFAVAYTTAARFAVRPAVAAAVLLWLPVVVMNAAADPAPQDSSASLSTGYLMLANVLIALVLFFIGRTVRGRRVSARVLQERTVAAEANQRALAAHAVADERRRIARELHDVVAHHVSVISVLATGARRVLRRDPDAADEALGTIADTSRTTLREMRRLLDVLRTDSEPDAELTPQPGLAGIEALVEQVREAGLPVRLTIDGDPVPLETGVALTVYRIVQEALTNALKHAGAATAAVRLCFDAGGLTVQVSDNGRGPVPHYGSGVGHGLVGMRERVALYGGTLRTGPRPGGGFTVDATIPMDQLGAAA